MAATRILFVEAEPWEHGALKQRCPGACEFFTRSTTINDVPDNDLPEGVTVLSPFVHSRITREQLGRLPDLQCIATRSTGYDHIDVDACTERGILVCNVPHYGEQTVAEHAFALLLALTRKIHRSYERTVRGDFSIEGLRGIDLGGRTFGSLGTGSIARHALRIAGGFGMRRIAYDLRPDEAAAKEIGFQYVDFDTLLRDADVLSIHVPHNPHTHHMIDANALAKMKRGAILINTARGGIVDPQALLDALGSGRLGGAGLDVLEAETTIGEEAELLSSSYDVETLRKVVQNHALLRFPNVIITPHIAFNSEEAVMRIVDTTVENIHAFLAGEARHVVNPGAMR